MFKEIGSEAIKIKSTIDLIKSTISDIVKSATDKVSQLKHECRKNEREMMDENANLLKELSGLKESITSLTRTKAEYEILLSENMNEIEDIEKENMNYKTNEKDLESVVLSLKNMTKDIEEEIDTLVTRKENLIVKNQEEMEEIEQTVQKYKKHLGMEIKPIRNGVIKLYFTINKTRCWALFDFTATTKKTDNQHRNLDSNLHSDNFEEDAASENILIETEPVCNLASLNGILKEEGNFYDFLLQLREECKRQI